MKETAGILQRVMEERVAQESKWGEQNHSPCLWIAILLEEVGEVAKAFLEGRGAAYENELVQVAAVAVAAVESKLRGNLGEIDSTVKLQTELAAAREEIKSLRDGIISPPVIPQDHISAMVKTIRRASSIERAKFYLKSWIERGHYGKVR